MGSRVWLGLKIPSFPMHGAWEAGLYDIPEEDIVDSWFL